MNTPGRLSRNEYTWGSKLPGADYTEESRLPGSEYTGTSYFLKPNNSLVIVLKSILFLRLSNRTRIRCLTKKPGTKISSFNLIFRRQAMHVKSEINLNLSLRCGLFARVYFSRELTNGSFYWESLVM